MKAPFYFLPILSCLICLIPGSFPSQAQAEVTISGVQVLCISDTTAVIQWTTPILTTGQVEYSSATLPTRTVSDTSMSYWHSITLTGLAENTSYYYRVKATEPKGKETGTASSSFVTRSRTELETRVKAARSGNDLPRVYFVSNSGDDVIHDGLNTATAWKTITHALEVAEAGDIVRVQAGVYAETPVLKHSGLDTHPIQILGEGQPVLDGGGNTPYGFYASDKEHFTLSGFIVQNFTASGIYLLSSYNMNGIRIENNELTNTGVTGIHIRGINGVEPRFTNLRVAQNVITQVTTGANDGAISANAMIYSTVTGNSVHDIGMGCGITWRGWYSAIHGNTLVRIKEKAITTGLGSYCVVANNTIEDVNRGIRFDYHCENYSILNNRIKNGTHSGLDLYADNEFVTVEGNTLNNAKILYLGGRGMHIWGNWFINSITEISGTTADPGLDTPAIVTDFQFNYNHLENGQIFIVRDTNGAEVKNNIFVNSTRYPAVYSGFVSGSRENVLIQNNVFYNCPNDAIRFSNGTFTPCLIQNNIFDGGSGLAVSATGTSMTVTVTYNGLFNHASPAFQGVTALSTLEADPLFADPEGNDFHLKSQYGRWSGTAWVCDPATSPCLDAGNPASDYTSEPEPNGGRIEMGVYGNTDEASKSESYGTPPRRPGALEAVEVYPNPLIRAQHASNVVTFKNLPREAKLIIYNVAGLPMAMLNHSAATDGESARWNTSGLSSGVYIYTLFSGAEKRNGKLSIVR